MTVKSPRVGSNSDINLHGRVTPEGFAVEYAPDSIPISGNRSDGTLINATVLLPNSYAWLNLKLQAAHDWLNMTKGELKMKQHSEKHVLDVYILTAMLTEDDIHKCKALVRHYHNNPVSNNSLRYASELFGTEETAGIKEIVRQLGSAIDYRLFYDALEAALTV